MTPIAQSSRSSAPWLWGSAAALAIGCGIGQHYNGYQKDFFDYRFTTTKDPDDLASFYGGEEFMELFCVVPFMGTLMMRNGTFDDEGTVHTTGFPGDMQVSMVFSDEDDEDGKTKWFNKRERFRDVLFGYTCWDMVTNFGFETLEDGRIMVYHHGEYFSSKFPPFSLLARFIFGIHAQWVAWSTEHYLNHYAFAENEVDEKLEEEARADMPLFLLKYYGYSDLMASLFGRRPARKPSFLIKKSQEADLEEEFEEADHPVYNKTIQRHITVDIREDRQHAKSALSFGSERPRSPVDRKDTVGSRPEIPLRVALHRTKTLTHRLTRRSDQEETEHAPRLERRETHGSAAWEALRATNDPQAYQAVTIAARERQLQRKATLVPSDYEHEIENDEHNDE